MSSFFLFTTRKDSVDNESIVRFSPSHNIYCLPTHLIHDYVRNGLYEHGLIEWCKQFCHADTCFLDIGAHTGTYTVSLASCSGHVYSFEPQKSTFYALCGSVALSSLENVTCYQYALGSPEQRGQKTLHHVSPDGGGSSLVPDDMSRVVSSEHVSVVTLDDLDIQHVGFMKIDVEGNELDVLRGAQSTLVKYKPHILFEANSTDHAAHTSEFLRRQCGYHTVVPVTGSSNMFLAAF